MQFCFLLKVRFSHYRRQCTFGNHNTTWWLSQSWIRSKKHLLIDKILDNIRSFTTLQGLPLDPVTSPTWKIWEITGKISTKGLREAKILEYSRDRLAKNAFESRIFDAGTAWHVPDRRASLCATIFELNLQKWVHFWFSNKCRASLTESMKNRLRRKSGWYKNIFCEKSHVDTM